MQPIAEQLKIHRAELQEQIERTDSAIKILGGEIHVAPRKKRKHHRLTPEGRKRLSDGMRKRWAERRKQPQGTKVA